MESFIYNLSENVADANLWTYILIIIALIPFMPKLISFILRTKEESTESILKRLKK